MLKVNLFMLQMVLGLWFNLATAILWLINAISCKTSDYCPPWKYQGSAWKKAMLKYVNCTITQPVLKDVHFINLKHTLVGSLFDYQFANFTNLEQVYIDYNRIASVAETVFFGSCNIRILSLRYNQIHNLPEKLLNCHQRLGQFAVCGNYIKHIFPVSFHLPPRTVKNDFQNNDTILFRGLETVRTLDLHHNEITTLEDLQFSGLMELLSIGLGHNYIASIEPNTFANASSCLSNLDLSFNNISQLHASLFRPLKRLTMLMLHNNCIHILDPILFWGLFQLRIIVMSNNEIVDIPQNLFKDSLQVSVIILRHNKLSRFDTHTFVHLTSLLFLDLGENNLPWLITNTTTTHVDLSNTVICGEGRCSA